MSSPPSSSCFYYPTLLAYLASTFAYVINPALAANGLYTAIIIVTLFWTGERRARLQSAATGERIPSRDVRRHGAGPRNLRVLDSLRHHHAGVSRGAPADVHAAHTVLETGLAADPLAEEA